MSKDFSSNSAKFPRDSHLTEFYPYLNGSLQTATPTISPALPSRRESFSTANSTYTSFSPSLLSYTNLISKAEIEETITCFSDLVLSSEEYRSALSMLVHASNKFAGSLENVAKLKGLENSDSFLSASGLFYLIGNHQQIISENLKTSFELPLKSEIVHLNQKLEDNDIAFKDNYKSLLKILKTQELENIKISKLKKRNLLNYKHNLLQLTSNLDEIDKLKHEYYSTSQGLVNEASNTILSNLSSSIRAQVEIYEGIARKGWSGNGLDDLISQGLDPFIIDEEEEEDDDDDQQIDNDTLTQADQQLTTDADDEDAEEDQERTIDTGDAIIQQQQQQPSLHSHINKNGLTYTGPIGSSDVINGSGALPVLTPVIHSSNNNNQGYSDEVLLTSTPQQQHHHQEKEEEEEDVKFNTLNSKESDDYYYRNDTIINTKSLGDNVNVKDYHSDMLENKWRDKSLDMGKSSSCHGEIQNHNHNESCVKNIKDPVAISDMNSGGNGSDSAADDRDIDDDDNSFSLPLMGSRGNNS